MAGNAENVSIWWRHHGLRLLTTKSDWVKMTKYVPQSSVLCPMLFNISVNDLFYVLGDTCPMYNYADDNTLGFYHTNFGISKSKLERFYNKSRLAGCMMTSSNGNIFRVTGPLCGEFTGPGEFPTQRPVTRSFDVFFDLRLNKPLSKQSWGWWFETLSRSLWRHRNGESCEI